ncbi:MAG TPA: Nif3-like dinuclear metal center hexameric protein [Candidatus Kryptonia bacterium]
MLIRIGLLMTLISCSTLAQVSKPTAEQVIERIKKNVGVSWFEPTVDTFKAGDSSDTVRGIAVTMMSTLDVLQRAAADGDNLIITHEPTFYGHEDQTTKLLNDPVYVAKQAFIKEHHLIIWRFHDHWHARRPDGIHTGMIHALGWEEFKDKDNDYVFHLQPTTLKELALSLKQKLGIHTLRVIGDSSAKVSTVSLSEGFPGFDSNRRYFQFPGVDVMIMGEGHEWETIEYAADAVTENNKKGLIVLGHIPSEQAGMEECARWLRTFVNEVPVEFVPAKEPFWVAE